MELVFVWVGWKVGLGMGEVVDGEMGGAEVGRVVVFVGDWDG